VNGLLVAPRDLAALATAISQILTDPAPRPPGSQPPRRGPQPSTPRPDLARQVLEVYWQVTGCGTRLPDPVGGGAIAAL
jgi:hypothetical protein